MAKSVSTKEAAAAVNVSESLVRRWRRDGLRARKIRGSLRFNLAEVKAWAKEAGSWTDHGGDRGGGRPRSDGRAPARSHKAPATSPKGETRIPLSKSEQQARLSGAKLVAQIIRNKKALGQLLDADSVRSAWSRRCLQASERWRNVGYETSIEAAGAFHLNDRQTGELRAMIDHRIDEVMESLSSMKFGEE